VKKFGSWLKSLSVVKKVLFGIVTLGVLSAISASGQPTTLNSSNAAHTSGAVQQQTKSTTKAQSKAPTVTTKTETDTQSIPFTSTTVNDSSLAKGQTAVTTTGVNGSETLTYQITDTNGQQTAKKLTGTVVTTQPVTQVTSIGTYVAPAPAPAPVAQDCPNGTYVNSSGNTVCSPYASTAAPAGATAQCVDGTYSFSQHHSGTCSSHGGVSQWL
jgi:resuscitation-promoting factor RpfB